MGKLDDRRIATEAQARYIFQQHYPIAIPIGWTVKGYCSGRCPQMKKGPPSLPLGTDGGNSRQREDSAALGARWFAELRNHGLSLRQ